MPAPRLVAAFETADDFLAAHQREVAAGGLLVRGAALPAGTSLGDCTLVVRVAGGPEVEVPARLAAETPGQGVLVIFPAPPEPLHALAARLRDPAGAAAAEAGAVTDTDTSADTDADADADTDPGAGAGAAAGGAAGSAARTSSPGAARARDALSMPDKMRLALSCDREQRFAFLRDPSKQLHPLVLRNPRIGLDEVTWAAKLPSINPEALKLIADHPEWGQNPTIAAALVRNPKTPIPSALKLLPRLPFGELRIIAKSAGRPQIVAAAKKLVVG